MPNHRLELMGQRFGMLTVIERAESKKNGAVRWKCLCDCGNSTIVEGRELKRGKSRSCGCRKAEAMREANTTHGKTHTRLFSIWTGMKNRCSNVNDEHYERYGRRGITVCEEWLHDFEAFYNWAMAHGYADSLSIDRIDNDKGYSPNNCQWATPTEQANNRSTNRIVSFGGRDLTVAQWCKRLGAKINIVYARLGYGWSIEESLGLVPRNK